MLTVEQVTLSQLTPHPRNYRTHPQPQVEELKASLSQLGWFRNLVISQDDFILAGHGMVQAARELGKRKGPAVRMPWDHDHPLALKLLVADNTLSLFADDNDRELTELLKELATLDGLPGTGFDEQQLAALAMITRPASELASMDEALAWAGAGMPPMDVDPTRNIRLVLSFPTEAARAALAEELGLVIHKPGGAHQAWTASYPPQPKEDLRSLRWEPDDAA